MTDFTGQAIDNRLLSKISDRIGSVNQSMLGLVAFNNENPGDWVLMDGQSCAGSEYETETLNSNVPDLTTEGAFLRQAKPGRTEGTFEEQDFKGFYMKNYSGPYVHSSYMGKGLNGNYQGNIFMGHWAAPGALGRMYWDNSEVRPKNVAVNHYIKINY